MRDIGNRSVVNDILRAKRPKNADEEHSREDEVEGQHDECNTVLAYKSHPRRARDI